MSDLDHMLNGQASRQRLQHLIRETQHYKLVRDIEAAQGKSKTVSPLRAVLASLMHLLGR